LELKIYPIVRIRDFEKLFGTLDDYYSDILEVRGGRASSSLLEEIFTSQSKWAVCTGNIASLLEFTTIF
jgi:muramoyltetrapeptide carboxypeptidase LdcA involved in peptidoglycan recycling